MFGSGSSSTWPSRASCCCAGPPRPSPSSAPPPSGSCAGSAPPPTSLLATEAQRHRASATGRRRPLRGSLANELAEEQRLHDPADHVAGREMALLHALGVRGGDPQAEVDRALQLPALVVREADREGARLLR